MTRQRFRIQMDKENGLPPYLPTTATTFDIHIHILTDY